MAFSAEEVLLRIRAAGFGEADTLLAKLEERLKSLGGTTARPSVDVDDTAAKAKLDETQAKLERVGSEKVTAKVDVDTSQATRALDDLKVHGISGMQGIAAAALAVGPQIVASLGQGIAGAGVLGIALGGAATAFGILGLAAKTQLDAASKAQKVNSALVIADTKKVAAAQQAVLLAEASGNAKSIASAKQRLALAQQQLDSAKAQASAQGSLANQVVTGAKDIKKAFIDALGPGTHELFRGILSLFDTVKGSLGSLRGPFKTLGTAIKDALSSPETQAGIKSLIEGFGKMVTAVGPLAGPILQGIIALGRILLNIATAAMPFLVSHAQKFADFLGRIVGKTSDAGHLHDVIAKIVGEFDRWVGFVVQLVKALSPLFTGEAGKGIQDVMNVLVLVVGTLAQLLAALGPAGRLVGAGLAIAALSLKFKGLKTVIGLATDGVVALLAKLGVLKTAEEGGFIASLVGGKMKGRAGRAAVGAAEGAAPSLLGKVASKVGPTAIGAGLAGAGSAAAGALSGVGIAAVAVPAAIAAALAGAIYLVYHFRDKIWGAIKEVFTKFPSIVIGAIGGFLPSVAGVFAAPLALAVHFRTQLWSAVKAAVGGLAGIVKGVAGAVAGAATFVFDGVTHAITGAAGGIKRAVTGIVGAFAGIIRSVAGAVGDAATAVFGAVTHAIGAAAGGVKHAVTSIASGVAGWFRGALGDVVSLGASIASGIAHGISSGISSVAGAAKGLAGAVGGVLQSAFHFGSPSKVMHEHGLNIAQGLANGITAGTAAVRAAAARMAGVVPPTVSASVAQVTTGAGRIGPTVSASVAQPTTGSADTRGASSSDWSLLRRKLDEILDNLKQLVAAVASMAGGSFGSADGWSGDGSGDAFGAIGGALATSIVGSVDQPRVRISHSRINSSNATGNSYASEGGPYSPTVHQTFTSLHPADPAVKRQIAKATADLLIRSKVPRPKRTTIRHR